VGVYTIVFVGHLDQLAKKTFAEETEAITGGAVSWQLPAEIGLTDVRGDGLLIVRDPDRLTSLAWPWPDAREHTEILVEIKMPGDHLDTRALERALLRRQARQVQRVETPESAFEEQEPLWLVAPILPEWLGQSRDVERVAAGCYRIGPASFPFLWLAANELPLKEELIPFLVARSGRALVEFASWVTAHRPASFVLRMLKIIPMSLSVQEEFLKYLAPTPLDDDPEIRERTLNLGRLLLKHLPELREELVAEGVKEGMQEGIEEGLKPLAHQFERRLGRPLTSGEHHTLRQRLTRLGAVRLGDVVLDFSPEALAAWLSDSEGT
jgi:hypothetical protein